MKTIETAGETELERKLAIAVAALQRIEEWRPSSRTYCQGCYCETESIAARALMEIGEDRP